MALAYDGQPNEQALAQEQEQRRREEKLVRMLKAEEEDALGYAQTEVAEQQMEALRRYFGEKYGDEEDGRSQVTTREVFETIEWTRPDLLRVFDSGGNVIELIESTPADSNYAEDVAKVLQWTFWEDNPGFELLDDFAFDGLLDALQELTRGGSAELEAGREAAVLSSIELRSQQVARKWPCVIPRPA